MKTRGDGKKKVSRAYASVSVNEVDHPLLYNAIKLGKIEKRIFSSASSFLASAGEEKLSLLLSDDEDRPNVTNEQLMDMLKRLIQRVDTLQLASTQDAVDDFSDIRDMLDFS